MVASVDHSSSRLADVLAKENADVMLLRRVADKDRKAFEILYRNYYRRLVRFLDKVMRQPELMEEVLDDTMLVVWQSAASFAGASRVSTWIFGIAYRKAMNSIGRERRHQLPTEWLDMDDFLGDQPGPEDNLMNRESEQQLTILLGQLSPEHRAVIELTYYFGYAYAEIAGIVGCPVDTVKTRMFYARRKLRALFAAQQGQR